MELDRAVWISRQKLWTEAICRVWDCHFFSRWNVEWRAWGKVDLSCPGTVAAVRRVHRDGEDQIGARTGSFLDFQSSPAKHTSLVNSELVSLDVQRPLVDTLAIFLS